MIKVKSFACRWSGVWLAIIIVAAATGCSASTTTNNGIRAVIGNPPSGLVSVSTNITCGTDKDGGWEWVWLCTEKSYDANFVNIGIIHATTKKSSSESATESFNNQKPLFIDEINSTGYPGNATNSNYFTVVNQVNNANCLGYLDFFPNQGDPNASGGYWGLYQGEIMCMRAPNCVAYATLQFSREPSHDAATIFNDTINLLQQIQILDN